MIPAVLEGALTGALTGAAGAFLAEGCRYGARLLRNRILVARGEPAVKDVVWRPHWGPLGALGAIAGALVGALGSSLHVAAAAGAVFPALLALTGLAVLLQARDGAHGVHDRSDR